MKSTSTGRKRTAKTATASTRSRKAAAARVDGGTAPAPLEAVYAAARRQVPAARQDELSLRAGKPIVVTATSARDAGKKRDFDLPGFTADPMALASGDADIVVELIGGEEGVARQLVETALANKKHVVTANKALLAKHGKALALLAEKNNVALKFEAAAAGGIPIVKSLRESLIAHGVFAVKGILNGT